MPDNAAKIVLPEQIFEAGFREESGDDEAERKRSIDRVATGAFPPGLVSCFELTVFDYSIQSLGHAVGLAVGLSIPRRGILGRIESYVWSCGRSCGRSLIRLCWCCRVDLTFKGNIHTIKIRNYHRILTIAVSAGAARIVITYYF